LIDAYKKGHANGASRYWLRKLKKKVYIENNTLVKII
jgi:hypothetical protein